MLYDHVINYFSENSGQKLTKFHLEEIEIGLLRGSVF